MESDLSKQFDPLPTEVRFTIVREEKSYNGLISKQKFYRHFSWNITAGVVGLKTI